jgi:hypothetical protein
MVRLTILDQDGKTLKPKDVGTAADLVSLVEQARTVIRECEQLADQIRRAGGQSAARQVPYG